MSSLFSGRSIAQTEKYLHSQGGVARRRPAPATTAMASGMMRMPPKSTGMGGSKPHQKPTDFENFMNEILSDSDEDTKPNAKPVASKVGAPSWKPASSSKFWWENKGAAVGESSSKYANDGDSSDDDGIPIKPVVKTEEKEKGESSKPITGDTVMFGTSTFGRTFSPDLDILEDSSVPSAEDVSKINENETKVPEEDDYDDYSDDFEESIDEKEGGSGMSDELPGPPAPASYPVRPTGESGTFPSTGGKIAPQIKESADLEVTRSSMGSTLYGRTLQAEQPTVELSSKTTTDYHTSSLGTMGTTLKPISGIQIDTTATTSTVPAVGPVGRQQPSVFELLELDESDGSIESPRKMEAGISAPAVTTDIESDVIENEPVSDVDIHESVGQESIHSQSVDFGSYHSTSVHEPASSHHSVSPVNQSPPASASTNSFDRTTPPPFESSTSPPQILSAEPNIVNTVQPKTEDPRTEPVVTESMHRYEPEVQRDYTQLPPAAIQSATIVEEVQRRIQNQLGASMELLKQKEAMNEIKNTQDRRIMELEMMLKAEQGHQEKLKEEMDRKDIEKVRETQELQSRLQNLEGSLKSREEEMMKDRIEAEKREIVREKQRMEKEARRKEEEERRRAEEEERRRVEEEEERRVATESRIRAEEEQRRIAEEEEANRIAEEQAKAEEEERKKKLEIDPEVEKFRKEREWEDKWIREREEREQNRVHELVAKATAETGFADGPPKLQPLRASLIAGLPSNGIDNDTLEFVQKEIKEQEVLIDGYQTENQRLLEHLRTANKRNRELEAQMADVLSIERENGNLKQTVAALQADVDLARTRETDAVNHARSARIDQLGKELLAAKDQVERRDQDFKNEMARMRAQVEDAKLTQKRKEEDFQREKNILNQKIAAVQAKKEKDEEYFRGRIDWYEKNQQMIDANDDLVQQQKREIESLKNKLRLKSAGTGGEAASESVGTTDDEESKRREKEYKETISKAHTRDRDNAKRIKDLQKTVDGLQEALKSRNPNSIAALISAAKPSEEENVQIVQLKDRVRDLEHQLEDQEGSSDRRLRILRQELDKMKLMYKDRQKNQKGRIPELEKQIEELRSFYQKRIRELERGQTVSISSPKSKFRRKKTREKGDGNGTELADKVKDLTEELEDKEANISILRQQQRSKDEELTQLKEIVSNLENELEKRKELKNEQEKKENEENVKENVTPQISTEPRVIRVQRSQVEVVGPTAPISKENEAVYEQERQKVLTLEYQLQQSRRTDHDSKSRMEAISRALELAESEVDRLTTEVGTLQSRPTIAAFQQLELRMTELEKLHVERSNQLNRTIDEAVYAAVCAKDAQIRQMQEELEVLISALEQLQQRISGGRGERKVPT